MTTSTAAPPLASLPPLREVIRRYGLSARRGLGQHFLLDLNLTARIARAAGDLSDSTVIEIGPGPGGLTRALLAAGAARVVAVERDRRCVDALAELRAVCPDRLIVIEGDALALDAAALCQAHGAGAPCRIVANLPYNIATRLLLGWLERIEAFAGLTLMLQKEVAQRLAAAPGRKSYGRLSVVTQWLCEVRLLFDVPAAAFVPPPKVASTVVSLTPRARPLAPADREALRRVTAAAFGRRRKMLRSALKGLGVDPETLLAAAGIAPTARAEELTVAQFCALARALGGAPAGQRGPAPRPTD